MHEALLIFLAMMTEFQIFTLFFFACSYDTGSIKATVAIIN